MELEGSIGVVAPSLEETPNEHRHNHSHHSGHRPVGRVQRHRRRSVLRHRLLRRWGGPPPPPDSAPFWIYGAGFWPPRPVWGFHKTPPRGVWAASPWPATA